VMGYLRLVTKRLRERLGEASTGCGEIEWRPVNNGQYEIEYKNGAATGWYRCTSSRLPDGLWLELNYRTSDKRYS